MKKAISKFINFISGWHVNVPEKYKLKKAVIIAAPHTSNWDLIHALPGLWLNDFRPRYFIKDDFKKMPIVNWLLKWTGAIWVNRSRKNNLIQDSVDMLKREKELVLLVPAEGSRSAVPKWKLGFYHIAKQAGVPILLSYLDYDKKEAGIGKVIYPSDDFEKDMTEIENFYKTIAPKYPEKYNKQIFIRKNEEK
jgi:1-acyl-sn-glycerol-3-phosphate acyltransferase